MSKPQPNKLMTLTQEQQDRMAPFAQEWINYGWRTTPLTEEEWAVWEAGARKCYEFAGIPWPGVVVRVSSPIVGAFAAPIAGHVLAELARTEGNGDSVWDSVGDSVWDSVGASVGDSVGDSVGASVRDSVWDSVRASVWDSVWASVRDSVRASVRDSVRANWTNYFGGRFWCEWPAFVSYFRDIVDLKLEQGVWDKANAYQDAMSAGWWWPTTAFVMVCDVPSVLHIESAGGRDRLHCATGPAVSWADGWGVHSWHGTRVPADLIETGWDVERIMAEKNTEIRRCAIEGMGWDRFVTDAGLTMSDECDDPGNPGQLLRLFDVPRSVIDLPVRVLLCANATRERGGGRHQFGLTVPTDCRTALSAAAWAFGIQEKEYRQLARAT